MEVKRRTAEKHSRCSTLTGISTPREPRPRDHTDAAQDIARDLAEISAHIGHLKGDANAYLTDLNYTMLRLRLEIAHAAVEAAAVEARRRVRPKEGPRHR
jgi:hypothetical protein